MHLFNFIGGANTVFLGDFPCEKSGDFPPDVNKFLLVHSLTEIWQSLPILWLKNFFHYDLNFHFSDYL